MSKEIIEVEDIKEHVAKAALAWLDFWYPANDEYKRADRDLRQIISSSGERVAIAILAAESMRASVSIEKMVKAAAIRFGRTKPPFGVGSPE